jgi:predicted Zn-dependent protease
LIDDPTCVTSAGVDVIGHYLFDDEGTRARPVTLIKDGVLIDFLTGRQPVHDEQRASNGHARNRRHERPISRMSNLIVKAEGGVSHAQLKKQLIEQVKKQKLPFGIMVLEAEGGETATEAYDFQAFLGRITVAVRVFPNGREELVRNVNFVGTPLSALNNILAVGSETRCLNGFCGAESGMVPVSTTCPGLLLGNLELQIADQRKRAQYLLPVPHAAR